MFFNLFSIALPGTARIRLQTRLLRGASARRTQEDPNNWYCHPHDGSALYTGPAGSRTRREQLDGSTHQTVHAWGARRTRRAS